jgi:hypothetical protein
LTILAIFHHVDATFKYPDKWVEAELSARLQTPTPAVVGEELAQSSGHYMMARPSAKLLHTFLVKLLAGQHEQILTEIAHHNLKRSTPQDLFHYGKMPGDELSQKYQAEEDAAAAEAATAAAAEATAAAKAAAAEAAAAAAETAAATASPIQATLEDSAGVTQEFDQPNTTVVEEESDEEETPADTKERLLKEARTARVLELLAANAAFVTRGRDRPKMEELLSTHIFIKHRGMIRKKGVARHGWFYDIGADQ